MTPWAEFAQKLERLKKKEFCRLTYTDGQLFCAVGSFIPEYAEGIEATSLIIRPRFKRVYEVLEGEGGNTALDEDEAEAEARFLLHKLLEKRTGLDHFALLQVQQWNDLFDGTPSARYTYIMQQVREKLDRVG